MELYLIFNPINTGFSLKEVMLKAAGSLNDGAVLLLPKWTSKQNQGPVCLAFERAKIVQVKISQCFV